MAQTNFQNREEIPTKYKWDLNVIYSNWQELETGLKEMEAKMESITAYKGKLKQDVKNLIEVKKLEDEINILSYKVYRYPQLTFDTDTRNQEAGLNQLGIEVKLIDVNGNIIETDLKTPEKPETSIKN